MCPWHSPTPRPLASRLHSNVEKTGTLGRLRYVYVNISIWFVHAQAVSGTFRPACERREHR